ncbi:hypothetical protein NC994_10250 [Trichocoleus sp. AS-A1]
MKDSVKVELIKRSKGDGVNSDQNLELGLLKPELQAIATSVRALAQTCQGDTLALLALLRALESWHREIRDTVFQASLPDNRQALYALLKDMEEEGGWPYIERMKVRSLLEKLSAAESPNSSHPLPLESETHPPQPG